MLWEAAMAGLNATNDDVLDLIEEVCRLRAETEAAAGISQAQEFSLLRSPDAALPWDEQFPVNP